MWYYLEGSTAREGIIMQGYFSIIEDPRHQSYVKHNLGDVLIIVMCAVMCGLGKLCDIVAFAENKADFFSRYFNIDKIPSKPTFSRILSLVDGQKVAETIIAVMQDKFGLHGNVVAVDGKAIRSTSESGKARSSLQIITAYLTESGVVLSQKKINDKTNEIPVFQEMLGYLNIQGKTITADAMHCQRETCALITSKGGDYVIGLKGNQGNLREDVATYFQEYPDKKEIDEYTTLEKSGGRIEKRKCKVIISGQWLQERHNWPGIKTAICIERTVTKGKAVQTETSYYITSSDKSAKALMEIVREHWQIESMHWSLDVLFSEDVSRFSSENAHICLNAMRKYALQRHKNYISANGKKCSVKRHLLDCLLNDSLLIDVIKGV